MIIKRVISGIIIAVTLTVMVFVSKIAWIFAVLALTFLCSGELQKLFEAKGYYHPHKLTMIFSAFIIIIISLLCLSYDNWDFYSTEAWRSAHLQIISYQSLALGLGVFFTFVIFLFQSQPRATIGDVSSTILGILYLGWFPSYLILLRFLPHGEFYLYWVLVGPAISDTGAFFVGKFLGKHKFFPEISPKKTIEGSIGGLLLCTLVIVIFGYFLKITWYHSLVIGIIVGVIAQIGDLGESLLKRDAGKKDSGNIIPGHGGILDRLDSYLLIGVIPYYYIVKFVI